MNGSHFSGSASSGKIASTGHSGSHAPQSMHSSGSITRMRSASWMQSTGQTSMHDLSLMSMQGSAMMYVTARSLYRAQQRRLELRAEVEIDPTEQDRRHGASVPLYRPRGKSGVGLAGCKPNTVLL